MPELSVPPEPDPTAPAVGRVPEGRYGPARTAMSPGVLRIVVVVVTVAVVGAVAWMAFGQQGNDVRGRDVGYSVQSPEVVEITFDVAKPRDATVVCTLEALNSSYAQVGSREVTIGPSTAGETRFTTQIATSEEAVTAVVEGCRAVE